MPFNADKKYEKLNAFLFGEGVTAENYLEKLLLNNLYDKLWDETEETNTNSVREKYNPLTLNEAKEYVLLIRSEKIKSPRSATQLDDAEQLSPGITPGVNAEPVTPVATPRAQQAAIPLTLPTVTTPALKTFDAADTTNEDKIKIFTRSFNQVKPEIFGKNKKLEIEKDENNKDAVQFFEKNTCVVKFIFTELPPALSNPPPNITPQNNSTEVTLTRRKNDNDTATWQCVADDLTLFSVADGFRLIAEQSLALRKKDNTPNSTAIKITLSDPGLDLPTQRSLCGQTVKLTNYEVAAIDAHLKAGYTYVEYQRADNTTFKFTAPMQTPKVTQSPAVLPAMFQQSPPQAPVNSPASPVEPTPGTPTTSKP